MVQGRFALHLIGNEIAAIVCRAAGFAAAGAIISIAPVPADIVAGFSGLHQCLDPSTHRERA